jgi:methylthioribose-1-phosphate isomerase
MKPVPTMAWKNGCLVLLDQRRLPGSEEYITCRSVAELAPAIRTLAVRGAPAIGIAAAFGCVLAVQETAGSPQWKASAEELFEVLAATRPTAVNLFNCLDIQRMVLASSATASQAADDLLASAEALYREDLEASREMGRLGADLLPRDCTVLTHCNAGGLATAGLGTALAVIYEAHERKILRGVFADETRPLLQGARLTSWELSRAGIPVTVIPDSAAAVIIRSGKVDAVITGADRIAMNGDSANKIGTYSLSLAAAEAGVPFYIVAPSSTFDRKSPDGSTIEIEYRGREELSALGGAQLLPDGVEVCNPAFDVTPVRFITSIISEKGIISAPSDIDF